MPQSQARIKFVPSLVIQRPVEVSLVKAHMAGSLGVEKAASLVVETLTSLGLPTEGTLSAEQAEALLSRLADEKGIVGLAAKVTKQMLRNDIAPLTPR